MKRWICAKKEFEESPAVDAFLADIIKVCESHGLWLGHEDSQGGFLVEDESTAEWLMEASDNRRKP